MALSTLNRHLKKQQNRQNQAGSNGVEQGRLVAVEVASAVTTVSAGEYPGALTVLLSNRRRVEVSRGFDAATLAQLASGRTNFVAGERLEPIYLRETKFVKAPPPRVLPASNQQPSEPKSAS